MKGKVKSLAISHKNGRTILRAGQIVTDKDVNNFSELVKKGHIVAEKAAEEKAAEKKAAEKKKSE
jgi:hypothetical protein